MKNNVDELLKHISERCGEIKETIKRYGDDLNVFLTDGDYQRSVCFNLAQIGELIKKIPQEFRQSHKQISWKEISGLRDIVVHAYGKIDHCDIYDIMHNDVDELETFCAEWLNQNQSDLAAEDDEGDEMEP